MKIEGARIVVTGAARGLGRHFALGLAQLGARVMAGDMDLAGLRRLAAAAGELPGEVAVAPLDISVEAEAEAFADQAVDRLGGLDALVNNAGILRDGLLAEREQNGVRQLPAALWRQVLGTNLTGQFHMARAVVAHWLECGRPGVVVNISSLARAGNPGQSSYAASKAGLDAATRSWALELGQSGVRVVGIAPGVIDTPIVENISERAMEDLLTGIPVGRIGRPEEVFAGLRFALECEFFNGRVLEIDGGASLG